MALHTSSWNPQYFPCGTHFPQVLKRILQGMCAFLCKNAPVPSQHFKNDARLSCPMHTKHRSVPPGGILCSSGSLFPEKSGKGGVFESNLVTQKVLEAEDYSPVLWGRVVSKHSHSTANMSIKLCGETALVLSKLHIFTEHLRRILAAYILLWPYKQNCTLLTTFSGAYYQINMP